MNEAGFAIGDRIINQGLRGFIQISRPVLFARKNGHTTFGSHPYIASGISHQELNLVIGQIPIGFGIIDSFQFPVFVQSEPSDAVIPAACPNVFIIEEIEIIVFVGMQGVGRNGEKTILAQVVAANALSHRLHPKQMVLVLAQTHNPVIAIHQWIVLDNGPFDVCDMVAVVARQSVVRCHPDEALRILQDIAHPVAAQARSGAQRFRLHNDTGMKVAYTRKTQTKEHEHRYKMFCHGFSEHSFLFKEVF